MRTPRPTLLTLAAVVGATLALMIPTAAFAYYYGSETNYAVASGGPTGTYYCTDADRFTGAYACFRPNGDDLFVKDTVSDGQSAVAEWGFYNGSAGRSGSCVNQLGAGKWGLCNKDFVEGRFLSLTAARYDNGNYVASGNTREICCT